MAPFGRGKCAAILVVTGSVVSSGAPILVGQIACAPWHPGAENRRGTIQVPCAPMRRAHAQSDPTNANLSGVSEQLTVAKRFPDRTVGRGYDDAIACVTPLQFSGGEAR